jgi:hypothetical protein
MPQVKERMVPKQVELPPSLLTQLDEEAASHTRYHYLGRPSANRVLRRAVRLFFALDVPTRERLIRELSVEEEEIHGTNGAG